MDESVAQFTSEIRRRASMSPLGGSLKLDFGDAGVIRIAGDAVTNDNESADCVVLVKIQVFRKIYSGELDPTYAYMRGDLTITGNEAIALKLGAFLASANPESGRISRFRADDDPGHAIEALKSNGVAIIESCIEESVADQVAAELRPHFDKYGKDDQGEFTGFKTLRLYAIPARSRTAAELIAHERVLSIADGILLPHCINYRIGSCSAIEIWPGETRQRLHRDDGIYPLQLPGVELQISALWSLTDFTEQNGATHVLPGSHGSAARIVSAREADTVQAVMPKGSVLLYVGSAIHGGGANFSNEPRMALVNTYALGWLRQEENQYLSISSEVAGSYPERMRQLLGYQSHGPILGTFPH